VNIREIRDQIESLGYDQDTKTAIYNSPVFDELSKLLLDIEDIYYIGVASLPSTKLFAKLFSDALFIVTNKRLVLVVKRLVGSDIKEFFYSSIKSIDCFTKGKKNILIINTSKETTSLEFERNINPVRELIYDVINGRLSYGNMGTSSIGNNREPLISKLMRENVIKFGMEIENVFVIKGHGTALTGVANGYIQVGDYVDIVDSDGNIIKKEIMIIKIDTIGKEVVSASTGDNIALMLRTNNLGIMQGQYILCYK